MILPPLPSVSLHTIFFYKNQAILDRPWNRFLVILSKRIANVAVQSLDTFSTAVLHVAGELALRTRR